MIRRAYLRIAVAALGVLLSGLAGAAEVTLAHGGRTLLGTLDLAPDRKLADGVVLLVHGTMSHRDAEVMRHVRRLLGDKGYSTLAVNLSLGRDRREGNFDCAWPSMHRAEDTLEEIGAWMDWSARQGARKVVLLGFSRGGQQAAWYAAAGGHAALDRLVLLAPIFAGDLAEAYGNRFGRPLEPLLVAARSHRAGGRGAALLPDAGFLNCESTKASANAFLSYYAPDPAGEPPATLARVAVPTLVVVAGGDTVVRDLGRRIAAQVDGRRVNTVTIAGADHFFRDLYGEDAVDAIDAFLRRD